MDKIQLRFSAGICAFNEEGNIEKCIRSILDQKYDNIELTELIVVSSGCIDRTNAIVHDLALRYPKLKLIEQPERMGKNAALNSILKFKKNEVIAIINADNILASNRSLESLVSPLINRRVGMTGGHPIPLNSTDHLAGFSSHLIWVFHHQIASNYTKIGELIAFRDVGIELPIDTQSDEDYIRKNIEEHGLNVIYVPDATTYIMGPETIHDLIQQRSRVNIGQSYIKTKENYYNPARDPKVLMNVLTSVVKDIGFHPFKMIAAVSIETMCRIIGAIYVKKTTNDINIWEPVESTKKIKKL